MSERSSSEYGHPPAVTSINSDLIDHYYKLQTHRGWVLEGIRAIAYRNMDYTVMERPGLEHKNYTGKAYRREHQNEMLKEQALDPTSSNRHFLDLALWTPWEVYACLLYAEIEYYERFSRKTPELAYEPLGNFLARHNKLIQSLKDVRDSLLHPFKEPGFQASSVAFTELAHRSGQEVHIVLRDLQIIMDDYLYWLQDCFMESLFDEMNHFSNDQLLQFLDKSLAAMRKTLTDGASGTAKDEIQHGLKKGLALRESLLPYREVDYPPGSVRPLLYVRWERSLAVLGEPLPERPYYANPEPIWVPRPDDLLRTTDHSPSEQPLYTAATTLNISPDRKKLDCLALVVRSIMLLNLNEPCPYDPDAVAHTLQSDTLLKSVEDCRRAQRFTSPFVVSLALLVEPLRLYREATVNRPELRQQIIEQQIEGDLYNTLSLFRNTIFHVPDQRTDYHKMAVALFQDLPPGSNRELIWSYPAFVEG